MAARGAAGLSVAELCKHFQLEDDLGVSSKGAAAPTRPAHPMTAAPQHTSDAVSVPQAAPRRVSRSMLDSYFAKQSDAHRVIMEQLLWAEQQRSEGDAVSEDFLDAVFHVADLQQIPYSEADWGKIVASIGASALRTGAADSKSLSKSARHKKKKKSAQHGGELDLSTGTAGAVPPTEHRRKSPPSKTARPWSIFAGKKHSEHEHVQGQHGERAFIQLLGFDGGTATSNDAQTNPAAAASRATHDQRPTIELHNKVTGSRFFLVDRSDSGLASSFNSSMSLLPKANSTLSLASSSPDTGDGSDAAQPRRHISKLLDQMTEQLPSAVRNLKPSMNERNLRQISLLEFLLDTRESASASASPTSHSPPRAAEPSDHEKATVPPPDAGLSHEMKDLSDELSSKLLADSHSQQSTASLTAAATAPVLSRWQSIDNPPSGSNNTDETVVLRRKSPDSRVLSGNSQERGSGQSRPVSLISVSSSTSTVAAVPRVKTLSGAYSSTESLSSERDSLALLNRPGPGPGPASGSGLGTLTADKAKESPVAPSDGSSSVQPINTSEEFQRRKDSISRGLDFGAQLRRHLHDSLPLAQGGTSNTATSALPAAHKVAGTLSSSSIATNSSSSSSAPPFSSSPLAITSTLPNSGQAGSSRAPPRQSSEAATLPSVRAARSSQSSILEGETLSAHRSAAERARGSDVDAATLSLLRRSPSKQSPGDKLANLSNLSASPLPAPNHPGTHAPAQCDEAAAAAALPNSSATLSDLTDLYAAIISSPPIAKLSVGSSATPQHDSASSTAPSSVGPLTRGDSGVDVKHTSAYDEIVSPKKRAPKAPTGTDDTFASAHASVVSPVSSGSQASASSPSRAAQPIAITDSHSKGTHPIAAAAKSQAELMASIVAPSPRRNKAAQGDAHSGAAGSVSPSGPAASSLAASSASLTTPTSTKRLEGQPSTVNKSGATVTSPLRVEGLAQSASPRQQQESAGSSMTPLPVSPQPSPAPTPKKVVDEKASSAGLSSPEKQASDVSNRMPRLLHMDNDEDGLLGGLADFLSSGRSLVTLLGDGEEPTSVDC